MSTAYLAAIVALGVFKIAAGVPIMLAKDLAKIGNGSLADEEYDAWLGEYV